MVMRRLALAAAAAAAAVLLSCNTNFAPQYLVRDLRVLAVRAEVLEDPDAADAAPGQTMRLTALLANPQRLAEVRVRWKACLPRLDQAVSPCLDTSVLRDPDALSGPDVVDVGEGTSVDFRVPDALAPLLQTLVDRARSRPELACSLYAELPVVVIASAPGAETRVAVKTARVVPCEMADTSRCKAPVTVLPTDYAPNSNPALLAVRANPANADACSDGTPVARACTTDQDCDGGHCVLAGPGSSRRPGQCDDAIAPGPQRLCARPTSDKPKSLEIYNQCSIGSRDPTPFFEALSFQWYASGGEFKGANGGAPGSNGNVTDSPVTFTAPKGPFTLWVIIRDGRGGEDWLERDYP
jgi:hypothetical protein